MEHGELGSSSGSSNNEDESSKKKNTSTVSAFTSTDLPRDLPPLLNMASPTCSNTDIITSPLIDITEPQFDPPADLIAVR